MTANQQMEIQRYKLYAVNGGGVMDFWDALKAQREEAESGVDDVALRKKFLKKQNGRCHWCQGQMDPFDRTLEHLLPHSLGGPYVSGNLALAHEDCNQRRGSHFNDRLLEGFSDSVLRLALQNLQQLPADAYEAVNEKQARVLKLRVEMEGKISTLLIQNLNTRHEEFNADMEPGWARRRKERQQAAQRRREASYLKLLDVFRTGVVGKHIRRYEKKENLASSFAIIPIKEVTEVRRRSAKAANKTQK